MGTHSNDPAKITFYFDVASAYSYIGFEVMEKYRTRWNVHVDYRPFILSRVWSKSRNTISPTKAMFLFKDIVRTTSISKIPFKGAPKNYPYDSTNALRVVQHVKTNMPASLAAVMRALWHYEYVKRTAPESVADVVAALDGVLDRHVVDRAVADEGAYSEVVANTETLVGMNAFGAPTIVAQKGGERPQVYFGSDRFEHIAVQLGKEFYPMRVLFANPKM